jgi:hypothetical protein
VISNAATDAANVVGLVFVAAFAPEEGERLIDVESGSKDSVLTTALVPFHYPIGNGAQTAVEFAIDPRSFTPCSPPTSRPSRSPWWPRPSARSQSWRFPSRRARPPGRPASVGRGCDRLQGRRH